MKIVYFQKTYQCLIAKRTNKLNISFMPGNKDFFLLVEEDVIIRSKIYVETRMLWPLNIVHLVLFIIC